MPRIPRIQPKEPRSYFDPIQSFSKGYGLGEQLERGRDVQLERERQEQARNYFAPAVRGEEGALESLASTHPQLATQAVQIRQYIDKQNNPDVLGDLTNKFKKAAVIANVASQDPRLWEEKGRPALTQVLGFDVGDFNNAPIYAKMLAGAANQGNKKLTEIGVGPGQRQKAFVAPGQPPEFVGQPYGGEEIERRKSELEFQREKFEQEKRELSPTTQKMLDKAQTDAFQRQERSGKYQALAENIKNSRIKGGVFTTFNEFLKEQLGTQDEVTNFRREYLGVRASQAVNNLPPGVASDKDIQLALSGFPSDKANSEQMESFLRGASKLEAMNAAFETFKAEKISKDKNTRNMLSEWRSKVFSTALDEEVSLSEVYYTAAVEGLSVEEVKDQLGIE